ncbi:MAG: cation transporter [Thiomargarita sp.]|nr:cation transporter [Thiomargarita sp.]
MPASIKKLTSKERYIITRNVTLIGVIANVFMAVAKLLVGIYGRSQALIADGLHSLSDLISDGIVLVAAKYSALDADAEYPYGYARFETLATVALGGLLLLIAVGILIDSGSRLFEPQLLWQPTPITLVITILSILVKEILYQYTNNVAKRLNSPILQANAWHHRSDAISSIIVFIGILGSMLGVYWLDAVAAMGVSFMIAYIGISIGWRGVKELLDTSLDPGELKRIKKIIQSIDGVRAVYELRTRKMGANALVDVHLLVNPRISVSEGHQIADRVRIKLIETIDDISDVLVHIDPEFDEQIKHNLNLPLRNEIAQRLQNKCCKPLGTMDSIEQINLHYLEGKITMDIYLSFDIIEDEERINALSECCRELATEDSDIYVINLYIAFKKIKHFKKTAI